MMHGREKSDPAVVAMKPTNKSGQPAAEPREGTEGNTGRRNTLRAQDRVGVSHSLVRVRHAARQGKGGWFTALLHHVDTAPFASVLSAEARRSWGCKLMPLSGWNGWWQPMRIYRSFRISGCAVQPAVPHDSVRGAEAVNLGNYVGRTDNLGLDERR